jgi:hypothetical protein
MSGLLAPVVVVVTMKVTTAAALVAEEGSVMVTIATATMTESGVR